MPQISRTDFAAKIKEKYPQFKDVDDEKLVDSFITKFPQYKDAVEPEFTGTYHLMHPQPQPEPEPDTFAGGFKKSIKDQISKIGENLKPALESAANPKTAGDIASLLIPSAIGDVAPAISEFASRAKNAISGGEGLAKLNPIAAYKRFEGSLPSSMERDIAKFKGGPGGGATVQSPGPINAQPSTVDPIQVFKERPTSNWTGTKITPKSSNLKSFDPVGSLSANNTPISSPAPINANPPSTYDPLQSFKYPNKTRAIKNPPSIPNAPVDVAPVGNISPIDARISNVEPPASPINTAFDPSKLIANPNVPSAPVTSDLRHSELLNKLGGKQGEVTPPVTPPPQTINIAGKDYQLDSNGNPIGFPNPPMTSIPARQPGADFRIYRNFFNPKYPD